MCPTSPTDEGTATARELRLPASVCPPLPPGWVLLDDWDRLVFHARPSSQGRPTIEVRLSADDTVRVSATTAREESYERPALVELRQQLIDRSEVNTGVTVPPDASWLDAVLGSWMGDFARVDAALQHWLNGRHPRRVEIAAQLYAAALCAQRAASLALDRRFRVRQARSERMIQLTNALHQECLIDFFRV